MSGSLHIGIDAGDILTERHGKSRHLQALLVALSTVPDLQMTLLGPSDIVDVLGKRYAHSKIKADDLKSARRDAYDIVWYPWSDIAFPTRSATIATIHDVFAFTSPAKNFFARRREQKALMRTARTADEIICCSAWSAHFVSETLDVDQEAITVVHPVLDAGWHPALEQLPFHDIADMPYLLVVPTKRGSQNLDCFIDAFSRAFKKREIRFVLCGSVPGKVEKAFAKLPHTAVLTPNDAELRALYRNAAAVAVPATQEPFSFVAAEASACGAAVIAAKAGSLPETIGKTALLVEPKDRNAWIDGLQEIIDDPAANAKLRAQAVSTWNATSRTAYIDDLLSLFHRVAQ